MEEDKYKLFDFDLMRFNYSNGDRIASEWAGTAGFSAPKMKYDDNTNWVSFGVDVWSIGIVILYCLNGGGFGKENKYKRVIQELYENSVVSDTLYELLMDGILVKNAKNRMSINELLIIAGLFSAIFRYIVYHISKGGVHISITQGWEFCLYTS